MRTLNLPLILAILAAAMFSITDAFTASAAASYGATEPAHASNEKTAFVVSGMSYLWMATGENIQWESNLNTELTSIDSNIKHNWKANNFAIGKAIIQCGALYSSDDAVIYNEPATPVEEAITSVMVQTTNYYKASDNRLKSVSLQVSSADNDEAPEIITIENPDMARDLTYFRFELSKPVVNGKFSLVISFENSAKAQWLGINKLTFYRLRSEIPVISLITDADDSSKKIAVVSETGALHMIAEEYDSDGNFISRADIEVDEIDTPSYAPRSQTDNSWDNLVAQQDQTATVTLPSADHYILVKAKSKKPDGSFSEEASKTYTSEGIETSSHSPIFQNYSDTVYYDMSGNRMDSPSTGINIKVSKGKTTKIFTY